MVRFDGSGGPVDLEGQVTDVSECCMRILLDGPPPAATLSVTVFLANHLIRATVVRCETVGDLHLVGLSITAAFAVRRPYFGQRPLSPEREMDRPTAVREIVHLAERVGSADRTQEAEPSGASVMGSMAAE